MTNLFTTLLALFIVAYGFLLVVGGGPRVANKLPRALGRTLLEALHWMLRGLTQLLLSLLGSVIRFVFYRPRR